jgi:hypothetical protein
MLPIENGLKLLFVIDGNIVLSSIILVRHLISDSIISISVPIILYCQNGRLKVN